MIHFSCDCCRRPIDLEIESRYIVRMEVYPALDTAEHEDDNDRDYLQELQDILETVEDSIEPPCEDEMYRHVRFDLCSACRDRFVKNPLGRAMSQQLDFSKN